MISSHKHTIHSIHVKKAIILANIIGTVLFALILLGGKSLSNVALRDTGLKNQTAYSIDVSSSNTFDNLTFLSIPTHPRTGSHDESMIEPESMQDDDTSEDFIRTNDTHPDHHEEANRIRLSSPSLASRPAISLFILHHSWKMHLS